jgi:uncharacterized membrane protein YjfL (UPF0719 family)
MEQTMAMEQILRNVILSIVFAVLGFGLLFLGYRVLDMLTPHSMTGQIFEEHNMAAAILAGAFVIALALIVSQAIA